jgi:hypothetical protein
MLANRLVDTRLQFLAGSMIMESDDMLKDNAVTVTTGNATVHLRKTGIYRFDSEPPQFRVLKGAVDVEADGKTFELKEGKLLNLTGEMASEKFDPKTTDALSRWSYRRAEYVAMANVSAAKSLRDSDGYYGTAFGSTYPCVNTRSSLWAYNRYFGMYTYVPCDGRYASPYGFVFWSPVTVGRVYAPRPVYTPSWGGHDGFGAGRGYSPMPSTSGGYSGSVASSGGGGGGVVSASPAPSAGAAPSSTGGVSHAGGGGGGHR